MSTTIEQNEPYEQICGNCSGSGEGMHDGSRCYECKGSGHADVEGYICPECGGQTMNEEGPCAGCEEVAMDEQTNDDERKPETEEVQYGNA